MNELIKTVADGFVGVFGNYIIAGIVLLIIVLATMLKHGFHASVAVVISVPLILALAMSGNLPQAVSFAVIFGIAVLVYYVIYPVISGGERP